MRTSVNPQFLTALEIMRTKADSVIFDDKKLFYDRTDFSMVLSRFIRFKEMFVKKVYRCTSDNDYDLIFDVDNSKKILWDILFLAEVVKYETKKQFGTIGIQELNRAITLKRYNDSYDNGDEHVYVDNYDSVFNFYNDVVLLDGTIITQKELFDLLMDAVCIFDAIRNTGEHNTNGNAITFDFNATTRKVNITNNTLKNKMNIKIDYDYLADFGYGIRSKPEHASLAIKSDYYHVALCDVFDINLNDGMDIFYRTSPDNLSLLMEFVNYDYKELLNLPVALFYRKVDINNLNELLMIVGKIEYFKYLPVSFFSNKCDPAAFSFLKNYLKDAVNNGILIPNALIKLKNNVKPSSFLKPKVFFDVIEKLIALPEVDGYKFSILDLPNYPSTFVNAGSDWNKINYLLSLCNYKVDELKKLNKAAFNSSCSIEKLRFLLNDSSDFASLCDLPSVLFSVDCSLDKLKLLEAPISDRNDNRDRLKYIRLLPKCTFESYYTIDRLEYILSKCNTSTVYDLSVIEELPKAVFSFSTNPNRILKLMGGSWNPKKLIGIPDEAFSSYCFDWVIDSYLENNFDLSKLPAGMFVDYLNVVNLKFLFNVKGMSRSEFLKYLTSTEENLYILNHLPTDVFKASTSLDRLKLLIGEDKDVSKLYGLPRFFFNGFNPEVLEFLIQKGFFIYFKDSKFFDLFDNLCSPNVTVDRLKIIFKYTKDINKLCEFGANLFNRSLSNEYLIELIGLFGFDNLNIVLSSNLTDIICFDYERASSSPVYSEQLRNVSLKKLKLIFDNNQDIIKFSELPDYFFSLDCSFERFEYLFQKTGCDIDLLKVVPKEFFYCEKDYVDSLFDTNPDLQVSMLKALFGTNNDKIISMILYLNAVFGGYEISDDLSKKVDTSNININQGFTDFVAQSHVDLNSLTNELKNLLVDDSVFVNYLKNNRLSFDSFCDFKRLKSSSSTRMTITELVDAYRNWKACFEQILVDKIPLVNGTIIRCTRNGIGHFKFKVDESTEFLGKDAIVGVYDTVIKNDGVNSYEEYSFGGSATISDWKKFADDIADVFYFGYAFDLDVEDSQKNVLNILTGSESYFSLDDVIAAFDLKLKSYKEKVESLFVVAYYFLQNSPSSLKSVINGNFDVVYSDTMGHSTRRPVNVVKNELKTLGLNDEYVDNVFTINNLR